jgi:hypothetical protein
MEYRFHLPEKNFPSLVNASFAFWYHKTNIRNSEWNSSFRLTHCHLCFVRILVPIPAACHNCSCVAYCSRHCRDADAQVHLRECKLLPILWHSKASITCFLALRAITQKPFKEIMKLKERIKNSAAASEFSADSPYRTDDYVTFYNLGNRLASNF